MMPYESLERKYGFLPKVPEHIIEEIMQEINDFATLMKHDVEGANKTVSDDIEC